VAEYCGTPPAGVDNVHASRQGASMPQLVTQIVLVDRGYGLDYT
jgi:hypothetical protein